MSDQTEHQRASRENLRKLKELLRKSDNRICADCGAPDPKWASSNIGVFICVKCSGVHRSLGAHISKAGMVEYIGILKVKVLKGANLVVKDIKSSDPYVVLTLGHQKAQTTAMKSTLNPTWNEELKFSVPEAYGILKLEVYDHDILSGDDLMGEAEIDLEPMIASAAAFGDPDLLSDMQIGKWLKSTENALIHDSFVHVIDGKIKQEVALKLQNVETGEVYLDMEWIPLMQ